MMDKKTYKIQTRICGKEVFYPIVGRLVLLVVEKRVQSQVSESGQVDQGADGGRSHSRHISALPEVNQLNSWARPR